MEHQKETSKVKIMKVFYELLETKDFDRITVLEIVQKAKVGRSTFYDHFEAKELLLKKVCSEIFEHVFSKELTAENSHDFSETKPNLKQSLIHLLYHLKEQKDQINLLFRGNGKDLFIRYFNAYEAILFQKYISFENIQLPKDLVLYFLISGFSSMVIWWFEKDCQLNPVQVIQYYERMLPESILC